MYCLNQWMHERKTDIWTNAWMQLLDNDLSILEIQTFLPHSYPTWKTPNTKFHTFPFCVGTLCSPERGEH